MGDFPSGWIGYITWFAGLEGFSGCIGVDGKTGWPCSHNRTSKEPKRRANNSIQCEYCVPSGTDVLEVTSSLLRSRAEAATEHMETHVTCTTEEGLHRRLRKLYATVIDLHLTNNKWEIISNQEKNKINTRKFTHIWHLAHHMTTMKIITMKSPPTYIKNKSESTTFTKNKNYIKQRKKFNNSTIHCTQKCGARPGLQLHLNRIPALTSVRHGKDRG